MTEKATLASRIKELLKKYSSPDAVSAINEVLEIVKNEDYVIERKDSPMRVAKRPRYSVKVSKAQSELIQLVREVEILYTFFFFSKPKKNLLIASKAFSLYASGLFNV